MIHAHRHQKVSAFFGCGQAFNVTPAEYCGRVWGKGQHNSRLTMRMGLLHQFVDDLLVPAMHTIEGACGKHRTLHTLEAADIGMDLHGGEGRSCRWYALLVGLK